MDTKKVIKFVVITYLIAWTIQIAASLYMVNNPGMIGTSVFQIGLAVCMFAPLLAALISKASFKGMGWKPKFKGNIGWLFFAAYGVIPFVAAGAALFFLIFPNFFDTTGSYYIAATKDAGVDIVEELGKAGMSIQTYILVSMAALIYAPFANIITAIGEETGWRGFLYPELNKRFSRPVVWIIGGAIWAAFHFPAMLIGGYEYGLDYFGSPWLGLIVFTIFCITLGALEEIVYSRTKCIWYAALLHGSINAAATFPMVYLNINYPDVEKYMIFGPVPNGIIAGLPLIVLAVIMGIAAVRKDKKAQEAA